MFRLLELQLITQIITNLLLRRVRQFVNAFYFYLIRNYPIPWYYRQSLVASTDYRVLSVASVVYPIHFRPPAAKPASVTRRHRQPKKTQNRVVSSSALVDHRVSQAQSKCFLLIDNFNSFTLLQQILLAKLLNLNQSRNSLKQLEKYLFCTKLETVHKKQFIKGGLDRGRGINTWT